MEFNPYDARYAELKEIIASTEVEMNNRLDQLGWYEGFNASDAVTALKVANQEANSLEHELKEFPAKMTAQLENLVAVSKEASLGFDPRYWFSSERAAKKIEHDEKSKAYFQLGKQRDKLEQRIQTYGEQIIKQQAELGRYRGFDLLEGEAAVKALRFHLAQLSSELGELQPLKEQVEQQLSEPLAELTELKSRKHKLQVDIARAENFDVRLTSAPNSKERRMIHDTCRSTFGESKPARVIVAKRREIDSLDRTIGKLEDRLRSIAQRASRIIKTLVIDGNNLCYQQQTFIGLVALQAVTQKLSSDYPVLVVFDATIRRRLQLSDRDIAARFGEAVKVHVVASMQKADETVLDAADAPHAYVISNDRFGDFPEKAAVREHRLIRHEILNGKIFIHDLNLAADLTANACPQVDERH